MTASIYSRAEARERTIWPSFVHNTITATVDRVIIFGLYAGTYKHGHNYLSDIETEDLQRLIDSYNNNMAHLDMEEQSLVLDIAAKRYVFNVDLLIAQEKLVTKRHKFDADEQDLNARIEALSVDWEELETLRLKIAIAIELAENKIREIEAEISLEIVNGEYVDLEIAEKQLAAARAELKVLTTAIHGLEIQISIVETSLNIVEAEVSKSQLEADMAGIDARIADAGLAGERLAIEQAEFEAMEYEINNLYDKKIELIESGDAVTEAEIAGVEIDQVKQLALYTENLGKMIATLVAKKQENDNQEMSAGIKKDISLSGNTLNKLLALNDKLSFLNEATKRTKSDIARQLTYLYHYLNAVNVAEMLAASDITNTLTHEISGV